MLEDKSKKTILEKQLAAPIGPGVQRVRLADYGTRLAPGVEYRWFVAIVADPLSDRRTASQADLSKEWNHRLPCSKDSSRVVLVTFRRSMRRRASGMMPCLVSLIK